MKTEYIEIDTFLKSYNAMKRKLAMLKGTLKYYDNDIDEEISGQSMSHPAECDNIGAGRSLSISKKTENIALKLDDMRNEITQGYTLLQSEIKETERNINLIDIFYDNLPGIEKDLFKMRYFDGMSGAKIGQAKQIDGKTVSNKLNKVIKEFAETYNLLNIKKA